MVSRVFGLAEVALPYYTSFAAMMPDGPADDLVQRMCLLLVHSFLCCFRRLQQWYAFTESASKMVLCSFFPSDGVDVMCNRTDHMCLGIGSAIQLDVLLASGCVPAAWVGWSPAGL